MPVAAPTANAAATAFAASMSWVSLKYNRNKFRNLDYGSYMDKILLLLACLPVAAPRPLPDRAPAPWTFVVTTVAGELFARLRTTDNLLHHIISPTHVKSPFTSSFHTSRVTTRVPVLPTGPNPIGSLPSLSRKWL